MTREYAKHGGLPCPTAAIFNLCGSLVPDKPVEGFDYMAAVVDIYERFPDAKEKVHFYDLTTRRFVEPDVQAEKEVLHYLDHAETRARFLSQAEGFRSEGNSAVIYGLPRGRCVMLTTSSHGVRLMDKNTPDAQHVFFVLDHELGHVLAEHGGRNAYSRTMHECVADSFAALRHMQRFGTYSPALDSLLLHRAQRLVSLQGARHAEHFTSFTLEKLLDMRGHVDMARLTPQQTRDLATRIALAHTPNDLMVEKTAEAFKPFQDALRKASRKRCTNWRRSC